MSRSSQVTVFSQELEIPDEIRTNSVIKTEEYYRKKYPGVQIQLAGLMFGDFPHPKRIPYILICVDGSGLPVGVSYNYIK